MQSYGAQQSPVEDDARDNEDIPNYGFNPSTSTLGVASDAGKKRKVVKKKASKGVGTSSTIHSSAFDPAVEGKDEDDKKKRSSKACDGCRKAK